MKWVQLNPVGNFDPWDLGMIQELHDPENLNDSAGQKLLFENETSRLWELTLWPMERIPFRRRRYPSNLVCMTSGLVISRYGNGKIDLIQFDKGDTEYIQPNEGNSIYDLENIGEHILNLYILEFRSVQAMVAT